MSQTPAATALDVAQYFLLATDTSSGYGMTNLVLQKLLYAAQGFHLALRGFPLFDDDLEAWVYGPAVPSVFHHYRKHDSRFIPRPTDFDPECLPLEARDLLDEIHTVYGQFAGWKLRDIVRAEAPWRDAWARNERIITKPAMASYFSTRLPEAADRRADAETAPVV